MLHSVTGHHSKSIDMTQGVIWKQIVLFAVPLILGNVFQQLYNTVDSIVVGISSGRRRWQRWARRRPSATRW